MGASIQDSGGNRGKRALDAELNLVPFIDLLCSLISFLLMTAVWTQIARLELKQGNAQNIPNPEATPPKNQDLRVEIHPDGFVIVEGQKAETEVKIPCLSDKCWKIVQAVDKNGGPMFDQQKNPIMSVDSQYDYKTLADKLKEKKAQRPVDAEGVTVDRSVMINTANEVPYNETIRTMDTALTVGLDGVQVTGEST